jgi:hypothetical protein
MNSQDTLMADLQSSTSEPIPILERTDNRAIRKAILDLTQAQARKRRIGKTTLHYLRKRARNTRPLRIYAPVLGRLLK